MRGASVPITLALSLAGLGVYLVIAGYVLLYDVHAASASEPVAPRAERQAEAGAEPARAPLEPATELPTPAQDDATPVGFVELSDFEIETGAETGVALPESVTALHGATVRVRGFMIPTKVDSDGRAERFILTEDQAFCCFGVTPALNQWIDVEMDGAAARVASDEPVEVIGSLEVGVLEDDGVVLSLYRMQGECVVPVLGSPRRSLANGRQLLRPGI